MEQEKVPQYTIREATIDDVEAIRRMQAQSWRDTYRNDEIGVSEDWLAEETTSWLTDENLEKSRQKLGDCFADSTQFYRIALEGADVVGLLHVATKDDDAKHLWGLYAAKHTHGTGLAQQLMSLADEWIGDTEVDLEVASYNERAKSFYQKCGFVDIGETGDLFRDKIPITRMVRKGKI